MTPKQQLAALLEQAAELVDDLPLSSKPGNVAHANIVTEERMAQLSGYTKGALIGKRRDGKLAEGVVWWHDPDGSIVYDVEQFQEWQRGKCPQSNQTPRASRSTARRSESTSVGKANSAANQPAGPRRLRA